MSDERNEEGAFADLAEKSPEHAAPESEVDRVIRQASGGRLVLRLLIGAAVLGGIAAGVYFGRRELLRRGAANAPMVEFDAATVRVGSDVRDPEEGPAHDAEVDAFAIDAHEVTVDHYGICVELEACTAPLEGVFCNWGKEDVGDHPINCVDYEQATTYCQWLGKRLPTEVEWEYAAGGASDEKRLFPWGDDRPDVRNVNGCGIECVKHGMAVGKTMQAMHDFEDGFPVTAPVGSFSAGDTPQGLHDMAGNVWEWTASPYCVYPRHDCSNDAERIIRGGAWNNRFLLTYEVTTREILKPTEAVEGLGFRCAKSLGDSAQ